MVREREREASCFQRNYESCSPLTSYIRARCTVDELDWIATNFKRRRKRNELLVSSSLSRFAVLVGTMYGAYAFGGSAEFLKPGILPVFHQFLQIHATTRICLYRRRHHVSLSLPGVVWRLVKGTVRRFL